jgi:hypothetical protein
MQEGTDAVRAALRVLASVTERRPPSDSDLEIVRAYVPDVRHAEADELACEVIRRIRSARHQT